MFLDLGDGHPPVAAHSRVVWKKPHSGFGARFVRIDEPAQRRIAHLVGKYAQANRQMVHHAVHVKLPGLPARLRANARETSPGLLVLESDLGWLRVGSQVETEVAPGEVRRGRLGWIDVELTPTGTARLCLNVELEEAVIEAEPEEQVIELEAEPEGIREAALWRTTSG